MLLSPTPMMRVLVYTVAILLLSACGLKGPLYLPAQKPGAKPPPTAPQTATDEEKAAGSK